MSGDFSSYLSPGEMVRWTGRPQQGLVIRTTDALAIPFSLMWCGFTIFWEYNVWSLDAPLFALAWGAMFIAIGLYIVVGRFFWDAYLRSKISYALTDKRALILTGLNGRDLTDVDLRTTSEIRYKDIDGSIGTISFGPAPNVWRGQRIWHSTSASAPEFFRTENAASAYRLIQSSRAAR